MIFFMIRDPQISRLAKSRKIKKLKETVRTMFLNQIKHINVGFDSRTTVFFFLICLYPRISTSTREIEENLKKNGNLRVLQKVCDNAHSYRVLIKKHADISIEPP